MDVRLLGPLEAGDPPHTLAAGKQGALLALLALNAGRTVARGRIIDAIWGEDVPDTAPKMVQIHVSQLRKVLPEGVLVTRAPGYVLQVAPDAVDLHRAERLMAEGRAALAEGRPGVAASLLRAGLALWRGPALDEFDEPFAPVEAARIEELRLGMQEARIEADLGLGRHAEVVGELDLLVAEHPLREGLRRLQMLALYRCGRQAEALAAFGAARRALAEELGLEPSPALRDVQGRILRHDPGLEAPVGADAGAEAAPARRGSGQEPAVRYARSGDLSIAYEVTGPGPPDLVLVPGFVSHLRMDRAHPAYRSFLDRLAGFTRLIRFDKRGTGLSDRPAGLPDLETRMDDVRAVMDDAGSSRAVILGYSEGGPLAALFAATHPGRVAALVLVNSYAKRVGPDGDYPWAASPGSRRRSIEQLEEDWGFEALAAALCPTADPDMRRWWGERCRAAASPGAARALSEMNSLIDVRDILPAVAVPTLVVHRTGDLRIVVGHGRYLAAHIPGAELREVAGVDHFVGVDPDGILDAVEPWVRALAPTRPGPDEPERGALATCLALTAVPDPAALRREVARWHGRLGDGVAHFDGPVRAIRCGLALAALGPTAGAGVHTGEARGSGGPAADGARAVAAAASPGEVLVTATTRDLVPGSGLRFQDRGERRLPGGMPRRIYAATEDAAPTARPPPARARRQAVGRPPFVGRERELGRLMDAWAAAERGEGGLVLVMGDPGIGKTRLVTELGSAVESRRGLVLRGRALELEGASPYLPWSQVVGDLVARSPAEEIAREVGAGAAEVAALAPDLRRRLPEVPDAPPGADPEQARFRLLDAVAGLLVAAAARRPLLVVLEDLHAADPGSLRLLELVASRLGAAPLLIVATLREAEARRPGPLADALAELTREQPPDRMSLRGLGRDDVEVVLAWAAQTAPSPTLVDAAVGQTEGNPLFLMELARLLAQDGAHAAEGGAGPLAIPQGVREVIGRRLARLSAGCRDMLRVAAVLGREVGLRELAAAMEQPAPADVVPVVDEALAAGVLEDLDGPPAGVAFSHALIRETLIGGMSGARRAELSARVLRALERLEAPDPGARAARLLHHAERAEPLLGPGPVARHALAAGEHALRGRAHEEAADHFRRALRALGDAGGERTAAAWFGLGRALLASRELHELDEAVSSLSRAFDGYVDAGRRDRAIGVATHPLTPHLHLEEVGGTRLVERALALVEEGSEDAARLLATLGWLSGICRADADAAGAAFDRAIAIARRLGRPDLEVRALVQRQYVEMFHLRWDACRATGEVAVAMAAAEGDRRHEMAARGWLARAFARAGDLPSARRHAHAAAPQAEDLRERYWRATAGLHHGLLAALSGDWDAAREWGDAALDARPSDPRVLGLRAMVELQTGELRAGEAFIARLCAPLAVQPIPGPGAEHPFAAAHVPLCDRFADVDDAALDAAARSAAGVLALRRAAPYLRALARIGLGLCAARAGDARAAAEHHDALLPYAGTASVIPPVSTDRLLAIMARAAGRAEAAVGHGRRAVAFCARAGYLPDLAWSSAELAAALEEAGCDEEARRLRARAHAIARDIGMHPLAARLEPVA